MSTTSTLRRWLGLFIVAGLMTTIGSPAGQVRGPLLPRDEAGRPDLQGVWNFDSTVPLQRPASAAGKARFTREEARAHQEATRRAFQNVTELIPVEAVGFDQMALTSLVEDLRTSLITQPATGRLPALMPGVRRNMGIEDFLALLSGDPKAGVPPALGSALAAFGGGKRESARDFPLDARCIYGPPVPLLPSLDDNFVQIVQGSDHVALISDSTRRLIALGAAPPAATAPRAWSGRSLGRWEGDTLVVETSHFDGRTSSFAGAGNSRNKTVVERFTRTSDRTLEYVATVMDATTFQEPVTLSFPMTRVDTYIHESACHEHNYSLSNALRAARLEDALPAAEK